jgi:hypothetical protein
LKLESKLIKTRSDNPEPVGLSQPTTSATSLLASSKPVTSMSLPTQKLSSFAARISKQMPEQAREKFFQKRNSLFMENLKATLFIYILQIQ